MNLEQLQKLNELYEWMQTKKSQQISYPLDEASKLSVSEAIDNGSGSSALTQVITTAAGGGDINVPAAYSGTEKVNLGGVIREIPYL